MKKEFEDGSYLEIIDSKKPNHIFVTIAAKDSNNELKMIVNSVEIEKNELAGLFGNINKNDKISTKVAKKKSKKIPKSKNKDLKVSRVPDGYENN